MQHHKLYAFTLIEVLIALAVLAIALTAVMKVTSEEIEDTDYIIKKNIAHWVANNVVNEIQAGLHKPPYSPYLLSRNIRFLNKTWYWSASLDKTSNLRISRITVTVKPNPKDKPIDTIQAYLYENPLL